MNRTQRFALTAAAVMAATGLGGLAPVAQAAPAACTYRPSQLPVPAGATAGVVTAMAGTDVYAGRIEYPVSGGTQPHAAIWSGGTVTDLGVVTGADTTLGVFDVNASGVAVGYAWQLTGSDDGWPTGKDFPIRSRNGRLELLPLPAGAYDVVARVVTANGDIYGDGYADDPNHRVVFHWPAGSTGPAVRPSGFPVGSRVEGVDTDGTVAVTAVDDIKGTTRPYLWKAGVARALPIPSGAVNATISAISNGVVSGDGQAADFSRFGVVWGASGQAARLTDSYGTSDVNSTGLILGTSGRSRSTTLWQGTATAATVAGDGQVYALNDGGTLGGANAPAGTTYPRFPAVWRCS
ncbi:hypothetical protein ABT093_27515 [Kitasatospora sp. NPDC002551]|uniref:hypothetical protein n=1 Tax=unclassified Kitasatospora TaxID=2633591 RepID=UPI00332EC679